MANSDINVVTAAAATAAAAAAVVVVVASTAAVAVVVVADAAITGAAVALPTANRRMAEADSFPIKSSRCRPATDASNQYPGTGRSKPRLGESDLYQLLLDLLSVADSR